MALMQAIRQGRIKGVRELVTNGRILTVNTSETGTTPLIEACKFDDQETARKMVKLLLKHGANINHRDKLGRNALHWASLKGNKQLMNLLTSFHSIDLKITDSQGNSILFYAVQTGSCSFVRHVCKLYKVKCVKDFGKNKNGMSAADLALKLGHRQCALMCKEVTRKDGRIGPILEGDSVAAKATFFNDLNERVVLPPIAAMQNEKSYRPGEIVPRARKAKDKYNGSLGNRNFHPQARPESAQSDEMIGSIDYKFVLSDLNWIHAIESTSSYRPGVDEAERNDRIRNGVQNVPRHGYGNSNFTVSHSKRTRPENDSRNNIGNGQGKTKKVVKIKDNYGK